MFRPYGNYSPASDRRPPRTPSRKSVASCRCRAGAAGRANIVLVSFDRAHLSRVVAVANGKGGVGKTSLTGTVAGIAADAGYRVLLIDLDPQGNLSVDLGVAQHSDSGSAMLTAIAGGRDLEVSLPAARNNVDLVSGGERLDDLTGLLFSRAQRGVQVLDALAGPLANLAASSQYDLVLIDCPPGESSLQLLALGAARWLVVPTRGDAASLQGMARIAARVVEARAVNPGLELLGVALFDVPSAATRLRREVAAQIEQALGGVAPLFKSTIRHSIAASDARGRGLLIHEFASVVGGEPFWKALREGRKPQSPGSAPALAGDYAALVHELLIRIDELERLHDSDGVLTA